MNSWFCSKSSFKLAQAVQLTVISLTFSPISSLCRLRLALELPAGRR